MFGCDDNHHKQHVLHEKSIEWLHVSHNFYRNEKARCVCILFLSSQHCVLSNRVTFNAIDLDVSEISPSYETSEALLLMSTKLEQGDYSTSARQWILSSLAIIPAWFVTYTERTLFSFSLDNVASSYNCVQLWPMILCSRDYWSTVFTLGRKGIMIIMAWFKTHYAYCRHKPIWMDDTNR